MSKTEAKPDTKTDAAKPQPFYRIPAHDICMGEPAQFGQRWEARVPRPLRELGDIGRALHARFADFRPGDLVNICAFDSLRFAHLTEVASYRIAAKDFETLTVLQVGEATAVPAPKKARPVAPGQPLDVVPVNGTFEVRDAAGNTIEAFVDRKQAEEFARREGALVKPTKAA